MHYKTALNFIVINLTALLLISCSCSNNAGIRGSGDIVAPQVSTTVPNTSKSKVSLNSFISVTFSEEMDANTITPQSFYLKDLSNRTISSTVAYLGKNAVLKPMSNLAVNTVYVATLVRTITDLAGNRLEHDYTWQFTTGSDIDSEPPEVTSIIPIEDSKLQASKNN